MAEASAASAGPRLAGAGADLRRFLLSVAPTGAAAALQLVTFALTARALGPGPFGQLAVVYACSVIATDVAGLGADSAMVRAAALDAGALPRAWGQVVALTLLSWPPLTLAATAAATALTASAPGVATVALLVAGEILVGRATAATELALVARGAPVAASFVRLATAAARALVAVLVFGVAGGGLPAWAAATFAQATATTALLAGLVARLGAPPRPALDRGSLGFGLLLMLSQLARSLNGNLDRIVLAALLPPVALGLYASATRLQLAAGILHQAATRILYPRFFRAAAESRESLAGLTRHAAVAMAAAGLAGCAVVAAAAGALPLVLGPGWAGSAPVAAALGLGGLFVALQYPPADALTASGRQGLRTVLTLAGAAGSAALLAAGAALAGLPGAVAGAVGGQAALAAALWAAFLWRLR